ncbi:unnamed protein product [Rotaria socialis]|uniref:Cytochrome P450 n=1 Tax=Rotaria socialis TaxID=392032 RepID=A0A818FDP7_9BILA|nr:unnamed protein product [Rotaria socialis]CAF4726547.1 unnamed protein product [Rotaria socialis]
MLLSSFILASLVLVLLYLLLLHKDNISSIPLVSYRNLPVVGHLIPFLRDRRKFLMECHQRYGQCFTVKLLTQRITFVLSPFDWATVARNSSLYLPEHEFGIKVFDTGNSVIGFQQLNIEVHRYYTRYLKNRDRLQPIIVEFVLNLRKLMMHERMALKNSKNLSEWISTDLITFSHRMLFEPSSLALFGEINPLSIENDFRLFDQKIHYFNALLPSWIYSFFFRRELQTRFRLNNSWFSKIHPLHESDFIKHRADLLLDHPEWYSAQEFGGNQTAMMWASLANSTPALFWCLLYILRDTKALESIQQEIDMYLPSFSLDDDLSISLVSEWTTARLNSCVLLESAINETLRLVATPMVLRKCLHATDITLNDGRILHLKSNDAIALFSAVAHRDGNLFPDPDKFIFDRFVQKNADTVLGFMPFGMGKNICPGRYLARYEIKTCIALVLRHMEYKFIDMKTIPTEQKHRIGVGIAPPNENVPIWYRYKS